MKFQHGVPALLPVLAGLFLVCSAANAEEAFTPARTGDGEHAMKNQIEFPELRGDTKVAIPCQGVAKRNGKLANHGCFRVNPGDDTFIASVIKASRYSRLVPATYDGKTVDVVFQYIATFVKEGEEQSFRILANPGYEENVEAYGPDHVGAQRLMDKEPWKDECPKRARFVVLARANVDFDGTPGAASVEHMDGIQITARCRDAITQNLLDSRFIPAFADGEAVPSTYVELFGN